jgi:hypothetical protein
MKYCCEKFENDVMLPSTTAPNIRIIKVLQFEYWDKKKLYLRFIVTLGYEKYTINLPKLNLSYCPYCGINLKNFYTSEEYANEIEGVTF